MRGPEDFGAAFTALLEAAAATPDSVVRALNGTVARSALYDWKKGAHLPNDCGPLLEVVRLCLGRVGNGADLRGAPGDIRGWLDLLAEAKQTRDNQAAPARRGSASGQSSLRSLDKGTLGEVAGFLAGHVASLLQVLSELAAGRSPLADDLIRRLRETKGRYQTPPCVARPKILPAANLVAARQRVDLLRTHRRALRELRPADDRMLDTISALRAALEEIHGARIVFVGEDIAQRNDTGSATSGAVTAPADYEPAFDPRTQDPIITTVEVLPGLSHATIVVEGHPPAAVTPSGSIFVITVEARAPRAVILQRARAVVLDRRPPRRACFIKGITGGLTPRRFDVDLDAENPQLTAQGIPFPFTVSLTDPEQFWVQAVAATNEITWTIALDWITQGISGTTLVHLGGPPFSLYPLDVPTGPDGQPLRTACGYEGHEEGCPALTLAQLGEPASTFTPARDLNNECLFTGILTLRELGWGG